MSDWDTLAGTIEGDLVLPDSPDYDAVRRPPIVRFHDVRPQAVVRCATPGDVAQTLAFATRTGRALAIRSGGHCFAGRSSTAGIVLDVRPMNTVGLDGEVATIGAGARLGEVYAALAEHGRTIPAGCGATVGIAGLALGGGIGILGRRYGLTADRLVGVQVVLADGRVVDCDAHREPDLFWALRGGGAGTIGVVTSLTFATVPGGPATAFSLTWPGPAAAAVIGAWQAWAPSAPDELAASLLVSAAGDAPVRVSVFGAMLGSASDTQQLLGELADRIPAGLNTETFVHDDRTKQHLDRIGSQIRGQEVEPPPGQLYCKSEFFARPLPDDAVAALLAGLAQVPAGQSRELDFSPLGGAYNRVDPDATAFVHRRDAFLLKHEASIPLGSPVDAERQWLRRSRQAAHPYGTGRAYQNFPDADLDASSPAYYGANLDRLQTVQRRYDPDGRFRPVSPTAGDT